MTIPIMTNTYDHRQSLCSPGRWPGCDAQRVSARPARAAVSPVLRPHPFRGRSHLIRSDVIAAFSSWFPFHRRIITGPTDQTLFTTSSDLALSVCPALYLADTTLNRMQPHLIYRMIVDRHGQALFLTPWPQRLICFRVASNLSVEFTASSTPILDARGERLYHITQQFPFLLTTHRSLLPSGLFVGNCLNRTGAALIRRRTLRRRGVFTAHHHCPVVASVV
ncbi:hypothetical protein LX32DRAFT_391295 [Colletotrichum zoysiae]|uniref:Uncharacterized protein n=1 Tax=Colletotrichum zoysiae TaxID=1216348 RepID=A0AAD9M128_9PEZI|nr:hypothetical protein LX32DRAFT_391295 [Colletotrichum zoysiae]